MQIARRAVKRFMPGEEFASALKAAEDSKPKQIGALFTQLGENVTDLSEATEVVEHVESVLAQAAAAGVDPVVSVKPTHLGLDIDPAVTLANLHRLAEAAEKATPLHPYLIMGAGIAMFAAFWLLLAVILRSVRHVRSPARPFVLAGCAALPRSR